MPTGYTPTNKRRQFEKAAGRGSETMSVSTVKKLRNQKATTPIEDVTKLRSALGASIKPTHIEITDPAGLELARLKSKLGSNQHISKADSLPLVSEFERADMDLAISLMKDDISLAEQEAAIHAERDLLKKELGDIAAKYGTEGMRYGQLAVYYNPASSKRFLNAQMLVENGVPAAIVAASYKQSDPKPSVRVVDLSAPRKSHVDAD